MQVEDWYGQHPANGETNMSYLPCIEIEPKSGATANASVIWLHGLGASGHDFAAIAPMLELPDSLALRFIFPHASSIPVTINGGMTMPAWYDILEMDFERKVNEDQLSASAKSIHDLIDREIERGINSERIIVAGFSQGGAVSYQAALSYPKPLAGLMALSTYFATYKTIAIEDANKNIDILVMHGTQDGVVSEALGHKAVEILMEKGFSPKYFSYPMEHCVCPEQVADISRWISGILRPVNPY